MSYEGLPSIYQPSRPQVLAGLTSVLVVVFVLWSVADRTMGVDVDSLRVHVLSETELALSVSCAEDVTAGVSETVDAVRIHHVGGRAIDGDCAAGTMIRLSRPLGERRVFVEGTEWSRAGRRCDLFEYRPLGPPPCP